MADAFKSIRNIAIIAHVDHGKTTLVDFMLRQSGLFRANEEMAERFMDSMDLEKERGITIKAKNATFYYQDIKVNIVDTPGHSDFGGEVERALGMVDGAILLVDASEGPLPQTRFVLKKALDRGIKVLVCINKIDRPDARINEVLDEIFNLFIDLDATDEQANFDLLYAVGREGFAVTKPEDKGTDLKPIFDWIVNKLPEPKMDATKPLQLQISNIDYSDYVGRLGVGRISQGKIKVGSDALILEEKVQKKMKVTALYSYRGVEKVPVQELIAGDIAIVAGVEDATIGDCITDPLQPQPMTRLTVDEPTVSMFFSVNSSPLAGTEGKSVTSRKILERLQKELLYNVSIRMEMIANADMWKVIGRGELQLAVLIEQMRREGYELTVGKPQVILKTENGKTLEPFEIAIIDIPEQYMGVVSEKMGLRKGIMVNMSNKGSGRVRVEFSIPARGLIGYRSEFLTDTRGEGLLNTQFSGYEPFKGEIRGRQNGALISDRKGEAVAYGLYYLEERGRLFVTAGEMCYEGMIVGENAKDNDLVVNVCREKKQSNVRASGTDEAIKLTPIKPLDLEFAMEWIKDDEVIEVTPKHIRLRCRELNPHERKRSK